MEIKVENEVKVEKEIKIENGVANIANGVANIVNGVVTQVFLNESINSDQGIKSRYLDSNVSKSRYLDSDMPKSRYLDSEVPNSRLIQEAPLDLGRNSDSLDPLVFPKVYVCEFLLISEFKIMPQIFVKMGEWIRKP